MIDSFAPVTVVPDRVGRIEIVLGVTKGTPNVYDARYTFEVLGAAGAVAQVRSGNLVPHLTAQQITAAKAFLDAMVTKAQGAIG